MDDLAFLNARIKAYADYTNEDGRRLVDEQVRAYMGEALAGLLHRLEPVGSDGEALAQTLLRCQFADQAVARALEGDHRNASGIAALRRADRDLIALADSAATIEPAQTGEYIRQVDAALDRRAAVALEPRPAPSN